MRQGLETLGIVHETTLPYSPYQNAKQEVFWAQVDRMQRRSDGTVSLEGQRFEVPARYGHLTRLRIRYARGDLSAVDLVDPHTHVILAAPYPLDTTANADGQRRRVPPTTSTPREPAPATATTAPLLRTLLADYAATGLPPADLPRPQAPPDEEDPRS